MLQKAIEEKKLKNELSGAMIFLKFDVVTRLRSHFLDISSDQYFNTDYGLTAKTLALIDIEAKHFEKSLT